MSERAGPTKNELVDLFGGRPGWRLEPRSTPGATPLWCFVVGGKIEFSVTRDRDGIHLYVMETDQEMMFKDAEELTAWLRSNRAEAMREPTASAAPGKSRFRKLFEWS
jgi:hypothetical protein